PDGQQLPPSLKVLGILVIAAPTLSIQAECRGKSRSGAGGNGVRVLEAQHRQELTRWESMSASGKIVDWASRHEYSIVGGWVLSLTLTSGIISRNKRQTTAQKVVQACMWAQDLTIGIILTVAGLKTNR
ncbi:hypothetical protein B0H17DRAFT_908502, partial [Mycena rosella]